MTFHVIFLLGVLRLVYDVHGGAPPPVCTCLVTSEGEIKTYDNTRLIISPRSEASKSLLTRWDVNINDPCKFQLRMVQQGGRLQWIAMSVAVHPQNPDKFSRSYAIGKLHPGSVEVRGYQVNEDVSGLLPVTFTSPDNQTRVALSGDVDGGFRLESDTCPYVMTYNPGGNATGALLNFTMDGTKYQTVADGLRGWCQNCDGTKDDDYRRCDTLEDVQAEVDTLQIISRSCDETNDDMIQI